MDYSYYTINDIAGFQLLKTAWDIMTHTCFVFQPLNITVSAADFLLGGMYMLLAGYVLRKIFWW